MARRRAFVSFAAFASMGTTSACRVGDVLCATDATAVRIRCQSGDVVVPSGFAPDGGSYTHAGDFTFVLGAGDSLIAPRFELSTNTGVFRQAVIGGDGVELLAQGAVSGFRVREAGGTAFGLEAETMGGGVAVHPYSNSSANGTLNLSGIGAAGGVAISGGGTFGVRVATVTDLLGFYDAVPIARPAAVPALPVPPALAGADLVSLVNLEARIASLEATVTQLRTVVTSLGLCAP